MRVLFLGADLGGNVPPMMAVARELSRRGAHVEIAGIHLRSDDPDATELDASWAPPDSRFPSLGRLFLSRTLAAEAEKLIRDRRPDIVVIDCMALALIKGANSSGVPVVVLLHTFGEYWRRSFLHGPIQAIVGSLGFSPRELWDAASLRLLLTDRTLDPGGTAPEFADYLWTGTTELGSASEPDATLPRVLVSFSTTPLAGMRRVYRNTIEALRELPVDAIVTTGGLDLGTVATTGNVQVRGYVPHAEVLPGAALVISHGGHSTTMKTLAHGIPLLVLPLNPTADQSLIGGVVESEGLGRRLRARSSAVRIQRHVLDLLQDSGSRERARATGERLRAAPAGAAVAADRILEAAHG